ncbi:hypothetical protein BN137_1476 [Cronobacter condimenti 1330]|uniref:Transporter n=1 Tax=Cronobacter condimenti 1330 TaxID=1073999 RepID=K7ZZH1_9ENTR|nr:hypothetical protein [Cronobacter condimenti]ALB63206.1 transporter [Cronobacter condimenti 1330]CCJ72121.1 hypothetical protein BN137_1476 [Cronobacter condimenti 1330]
MIFSHSFNIRKISAACIFLLASWGFLHLWLILMHRLDERVATTLIASPVIYLCIPLTVLFFLVQKQAAAVKEWYIIILWFFAFFIALIAIFSLLLNTLPDIDDLVFYYECFLIIFFIGSPLYLFIRII